jgi:hypothetical protein
MTKKSYRSLEAEYKKLLNEKNAKSMTQTEIPKAENEKAGAYVNIVETPATNANWRGTSLAIGVGNQGSIRLHTNKSKGGACIVARSMTELDKVLKDVRATAQKLTDDFVPIPKKE